MVVLVLGTALLTFSIDLGLFHLRVMANRDPYGSVVVRRTYAVAQKNGKTQFIFDPPAPEDCVNALFPHSGMQPCWYLRGIRSSGRISRAMLDAHTMWRHREAPAFSPAGRGISHVLIIDFGEIPPYARKTAPVGMTPCDEECVQLSCARDRLECCGVSKPIQRES